MMFHAFDRVLSAFEHISEMKIKKPSVLGKVCRKLAKHLLLQYDENHEESKESVSLKKEDIKC